MNICTFDKKWNHITNNFTWNKKDTIGMIINILLLLIISVLISTIFLKNKKLGLLVCLGLIIIITSIILYSPVSVLYTVSSIISLTTRTPEFLDRFEYFPNCTYFEDTNTFNKIQNELNIFLEHTNNGHDLIATQDTFGDSNKEIGRDIHKDNKWRLFQIKILGENMPNAKEYFPTVIDLCNKFQEIVACAISVLEPHVKIPSHIGYMKGVVRYMLPLKVPKLSNDIFLCVNNIKYNWTEGVGVLWDDCYPHMVENNTDEIRVVLYFDIRRKYMGRFKNMLLDLILNIIKKSKVIKKEMSDKEKQIKTKK